MRERIILAPGANGSELLKSLAMHGVNCFGLRIVGAGELARIALMRSGISITEDFVSRREETALIAEAVKGEAYFERATYSDIRNIAAAIRQLRSLVADGDECAQVEETFGKGIFEQKNAALISVYKKYRQILADRKQMDSVSLIRKALAECESVDADFVTLQEYPLKPLEKALLEKLSGGSVPSLTLADLFGAQKTLLRIDSIKNCYGAPNEVETILSDIYAGKNLDKCVVAVTDSGTYGQLFFDYALLYDMPISFGCGIPIINSNPARLLVLYYHWMTAGFFGASAIKAMLSSDAFDRKKLQTLYPQETDENFIWGVFYDVLGGLRLTNDPETNEKRVTDFKKVIAEEEALTDSKDEKAYRTFLRKKLCIPYLEVLAKELALPAEEFMAKYSYIRRGSNTNSEKLLMQLDMAAASAIYEELKVIRTSGVQQATEDMILNVLKMDVASAQSEEGKLFVTGIDGALSTLRENLYIAGLSATKYPGSPREDYLLLDSDLELFGEGTGHMTSDGRIIRKKDNLMTLARLASSLGTKIHVSYAGLNVSELKKDNASSLVFELYREANGSGATSKDLDEHTTKVAYFQPAISVTRKVGEAYNAGTVIQPHPMEDGKEAVAVSWNLDKEYSPSALEKFFGCPRSFMLSYILGIPEPDDDRPFETIAANEAGTMAHLLMEKLGNSSMTKDEFLDLSGEYFDRFIMQHPPLVLQNAEAEKAQFLDMMETAYRMDPHRKVVLEEEDIHCVHDTGVKIHGFPDRVEQLDDGSYLVVDFKTARSISHEEDDVDTCLQIMIYAYLLEQKGFHVSGGEYRYIRLGRTVSCKYDDAMKHALAQKLEEFRDCMLAADFEIPEEIYTALAAGETPDACKYCKYSMICGRNAKKGGFEDA